MPSSPVGRTDRDAAFVPSLRVGLLVHTGGFAGRANNLPTFLELNRHFLSQAQWVLPTDNKDRALIDPKCQISSDSIVGESTKVGERTTVKRSVIGKHCVIGRSVKIVGCVLLDHCVVEDGAKLDGSILGMNTKVGAKAELVRCVTQAGYEVDAGDTARNEKLEVSDWAAAAQEDDEDDEDDDENEQSADEDGTSSDE